MGWVKGPGRSMKWKMGSATDNPVGSGYVVERGGEKFRRNPSSGNLTPIDDYSGMINQAVPVEEGNTGIAKGPRPGGSIVNKIDTSNIDFSDKNQVMKIQQALADQGAVGEDGLPLEIDGLWVKNTQFAYRDNVNKRREDQGLLGYTYDDIPTNDHGTTSGTIINNQGPGGTAGSIIGETITAPAPNFLGGDDVTVPISEEEETGWGGKWYGPDKLWEWMGYE